jgi:hypothetical protein
MTDDDERRRHPRIPLAMRVRIDHPGLGSLVGDTVDISDGGMFVEVYDPRMVPDDKVSVQACDVEDAPLVAGRVARTGPDGTGVEFEEPGGEEPGGEPPG